jgi:hypothetical protein
MWRTEGKKVIPTVGVVVALAVTKETSRETNFQNSPGFLVVFQLKTRFQKILGQAFLS